MSVKMSSGIGREEIFLSAKHPTFSNCVKQLFAKIKTFQALVDILRTYTFFLIDLLDWKWREFLKRENKVLSWVIK